MLSSKQIRKLAAVGLIGMLLLATFLPTCHCMPSGMSVGNECLACERNCCDNTPGNQPSKCACQSGTSSPVDRIQHESSPNIFQRHYVWHSKKEYLARHRGFDLDTCYYNALDALDRCISLSRFLT